MAKNDDRLTRLRQIHSEIPTEALLEADELLLTFYDILRGCNKSTSAEAFRGHIASLKLGEKHSNELVEDYLEAALDDLEYLCKAIPVGDCVIQ